MTVAALVLAAGSARRFGSDKLSADFRGEPLIRHAIRAARAAPVERVIVVTNDQRNPGDWPGEPMVEVVRIASNALSDSLKAGIAALERPGQNQTSLRSSPERGGGSPPGLTEGPRPLAQAPSLPETLRPHHHDASRRGPPPRSGEDLSGSDFAEAAPDDDTAGAFIFLGDMPLIPHDIAGRLAEVLKDSFAAVPRHAGKNGHPVLLSAHAFPAIARLSGDEGAGRLLKQRDDIAFVDVADDAILLDVDRAEDLARLERRQSR